MNSYPRINKIGHDHDLKNIHVLIFPRYLYIDFIGLVCNQMDDAIMSKRSMSENFFSLFISFSVLKNWNHDFKILKFLIF